MSSQRTMLILSFSDISQDARVLKQINVFKTDWEITTCGYGPTPPGVRRHLQIRPERIGLDLDGRLITLKQYRLAYWTQTSVREMARLTRPFKGKVDVVFADEIETVPIALRLKPRWGVHADYHEYTPSLKEEFPNWNRRIKPYFEWLVRTYGGRATTSTAACDGFAVEYEKNFGFLPVTVTNATPFQELEPTPTSEPIRIVHHGGAQRNRRAEVMIEAVRRSKNNLTFDLYLTGIDPAYREELRESVKDVDNIEVHDGIPYTELLETINNYDVGLHILPPVNFNNALALPNKLFDFVQARLGQISGPTPAMSQIINEHNLGIVTDGFEVEDLVPVLDALTVEQVREWKDSANEVAPALSSEPEVKKWKDVVETIAQNAS